MGREAIFIGYRREDTADVAGRIYDVLAARFGRNRVFKDVDNLRPGVDFGNYINSILPRCRVALILIGPSWLDARDEDGRARLLDPHDWVRIEIETALIVPGLDVVPVLVNGARMPRTDDLPEALHPLLRRHAAVIRRDPDFRDDITRLGKAISTSVTTEIISFDLAADNKRSEGVPTKGQAKTNREPQRDRRWAIAGIATGVAIAGGAAAYSGPLPAPYLSLFGRTATAAGATAAGTTALRPNDMDTYDGAGRIGPGGA